MSRPKVKICCISSIEEATLALAKGANILGLVGPMPTGPGILSLDAIARIVDELPRTVHTWLLTSETNVERIIAQHHQVKTSGIQLVTTIEVGGHERLRARLPRVDLIQVIHVLDEETIITAKAIASKVDYILLDSGNPAKQELGGTGRTHNWNISRRIVKEINVPVFLAGGLNSNNVKKAIKTVQAYGVDLCSGVRTDKQLDETKLNAFMRQAYLVTIKE